MTAPHIKTAIPRQRYQLGGFVATILADIDSNDPVDYRYIMALVKEGDTQPCLYVAAESNPPKLRSEGRYRLRVILGDDSKEMGSADDWGDIERFALQSLGVAAKLYRLTDEQPIRLM